MKFQASRLCLGGVLPDPRISRMAPGHGRRGGCASTRPLLCVPIFGRRGQSVCFVFLWVPAFAKGVNGVLCFSLGSRLRGNDGGHPPRSLRFYRSLGPPSLRERGGVCVGLAACFVFPWVHAFAKGVNGVLCFSLGSRLRGNDGPCGNDVGVRGNDVGRDESPGRYLVRSCRVNGLGFAPPPWNGGGNLDRVSDRACYQQSQTGTRYAPVTGPRRGGLSDSRQKSSACVVRRQDVKHAPRTR